MLLAVPPYERAALEVPCTTEAVATTAAEPPAPAAARPSIALSETHRDDADDDPPSRVLADASAMPSVEPTTVTERAPEEAWLALMALLASVSNVMLWAAVDWNWATVATIFRVPEAEVIRPRKPVEDNQTVASLALPRMRDGGDESKEPAAAATTVTLTAPEPGALTADCDTRVNVAKENARENEVTACTTVLMTLACATPVVVLQCVALSDIH